MRTPPSIFAFLIAIFLSLFSPANLYAGDVKHISFKIDVFPGTCMYLAMSLNQTLDFPFDKLNENKNIELCVAIVKSLFADGPELDPIYYYFYAKALGILQRYDEQKVICDSWRNRFPDDFIENNGDDLCKLAAS